MRILGQEISTHDHVSQRRREDLDVEIAVLVSERDSNSQALAAIDAMAASAISGGCLGGDTTTNKQSKIKTTFTAASAPTKERERHFLFGLAAVRRVAAP